VLSLLLDVCALPGETAAEEEEEEEKEMLN
jgi:hypothetical protein